MRFPLFLGALGCGALASSWRSPSAKTVLAKSDEKKSVFDHHYKPFTLGEVINLSEDTAIFRFLLPNPDDVFDLVACSTLQATFKDGVNLVDQPQRNYTPITPNGTKGYFDLIVRKYPNGRFTEHLFSMEVGESISFRVIQYKMKYVPNKWKNVGLIGGGTGITSLLQIMRASFDAPEDKTNIHLLFANRCESKILLRGLVDDFAKKYAHRFKVTYIIDKAENPDTWKGKVGHIGPQLIKETMPPPGPDMQVCICGPDAMLHKLCGAAPAVMKAWSGGLAYQPAMANVNNLQDVGGYMGQLGYEKEHVYRF